MDDIKGEWHYIKYVRVREELKPMPIWTHNQEIRPDWLAIEHAKTWTERFPEPKDTFLVNFLSDDGFLYETIEYDTLEIAMNQTKAISGVGRSEWHDCLVSLESKETVSWADVQ